jgi:hypothetical protein
MKNENDSKKNMSGREQREEISKLTPFSMEDMEGQRFARGSMLGGAVPVQEAAHDAPWIKKDDSLS